MSYDGGSRVVEEPLPDSSHRPDVVCCPHCRGTGVVLRKKLSPGQLRKSEQEQEELETKRQRFSNESSGNNRALQYHRRNEEDPPNFSHGRQNESWRRNKQGGQDGNFGQRRQNSNWRNQDINIWQEEPTFDDHSELDPIGNPNKQQQQRQQPRKRQRKREEFSRMNDTDSRFPSQYQSLLSNNNPRYDYREDQFKPAPLPLMPPSEMKAAVERQRPQHNHPQRRRPRPGNRQQFPQNEPMSEMDLFSLGVLYGTCIQ